MWRFRDGGKDGVFEGRPPSGVAIFPTTSYLLRAMRHRPRHLLGLSNITSGDIHVILDEAVRCVQSLENNISQKAVLSGYCVVISCWPLRSEGEDGDLLTRYDIDLTNSFAEAAQYLGALSSSISPHPCESLQDVIRSVTVIAKQCSDRSLPIVVRHSQVGVPTQITSLEEAQNNSIVVINAGDGSNEHPTEALLYMYLIRERFREFSGLKILVVGDLAHSQIGRSLLFGLGQFPIDLHVVSLPGLLLKAFPSNTAINVHYKPANLRMDFDVVIMIPITPSTLMRGLVPSERECVKFFSLFCTADRISTKQPMVLTCPSTEPGSLEIPLRESDGKSLGELVNRPTGRHAVGVRMAALKWSVFGLS